MDTKHKIAFYLFFIAILIVLFINMCRKQPVDYLDRALLHLDSAQKHLDSALAKIDSTRIVIDSMNSNFNSFQDQMNYMRADVTQLNERSKSSEKSFKSSLNELKTRNQKVLEQLKVHRDSLPEIKIVN
ncbi:MAG: hypothetical protein ABI723_06565 [Bacteroidia bacterium]